MPAHQGLWPNDLDGLEDRWKPPIQLDEEQAIVVGELDATAYLALQDDQLTRRSAAFSASSRLLDLKIEATRFKKRNISATIVANVRRFGQPINTNEVSEHTPATSETTSGTSHVRSEVSRCMMKSR
jgi:hypothetical protein